MMDLAYFNLVIEIDSRDINDFRFINGMCNLHTVSYLYFAYRFKKERIKLLMMY